MTNVSPLTKLYFILFTITSAFFISPSLQIILCWILLILALFSDARKEIMRKLLRYIFPVIAFMLALNGLLYPEAHRRIIFLGFAWNIEGLQFGLNLSLRVLILALSLLLFFHTTPAHYLSNALLAKRFNPRLVYIFLYSIQLLEALRRKINKIFIAQSSRGLNVSGSPIRRVKAFFPILLPLILSYLSESLDRGLALELKGFGIGGKKTFLVEVRETKTEILVGRIFLLFTLLTLLWGISKWLAP